MEDLIRREDALAILDLAEHDAEERDWRSGANEIARLIQRVRSIPASPEVAKLVADAEARGMEWALETMKTTGDSAVTEAMGQRLCCNGQDCGCHGATVEQYLEHLIRAEASAIRRAAEETGA